jgi:hypothetical protein
MVTQEELQRTYAGLSTEKLLEMLDHKSGYTELAITVATKELSTRKVTEADVKKYEDKKVEEVNSFIKKNTVDDLTLVQKIVFYIVFIPLRFALKMNFREDGYLLKLKQANYYTYASLISLFFAAFISMFFGLGGTGSVIIWGLGFIPAYMFDEYFNRRRQIEKFQKIFNIDEHPLS